MSAHLMQDLIRRLQQEPAVEALWAAGESAQPGAAARVVLHVAGEAGALARVGAWAREWEGCVYSGPEAGGWCLITADGSEWLLWLHPPGEAPSGAGLTALFDRRVSSMGPASADGDHEPASRPAADGYGAAAEGSGGTAVGRGVPVDLSALIGDFWRDLFRAARAIRREQTLTAHRWLFACGGRLLDVYRLALAPGTAGTGWEGADDVPGLPAALERVRPALAAPLDLRAQRSAARRLAEAFEGLVLPLCERLGLAYPMALRSLAFQELDAGYLPVGKGGGSGTKV